jgi:hypothetical protein
VRAAVKSLPCFTDVRFLPSRTVLTSQLHVKGSKAAFQCSWFAGSGSTMLSYVLQAILYIAVQYYFYGIIVLTCTPI